MQAQPVVATDHAKHLAIQWRCGLQFPAEASGCIQ